MNLSLDVLRGVREEQNCALLLFKSYKAGRWRMTSDVTVRGRFKLFFCALWLLCEPLQVRVTVSSPSLWWLSLPRIGRWRGPGARGFGHDLL